MLQRAVHGTRLEGIVIPDLWISKDGFFGRWQEGAPPSNWHEDTLGAPAEHLLQV